MPPTRDARTVAKTSELAVASVTSHSKKDCSCSCLSTRIQAWSASVDTSQKQDTGVINDYSSTTRASRTSIGLEVSRAVSTSDSDSDSLSSDESVVDERNGDHKCLARKHHKATVVALETSNSSPQALESSIVSTTTELGEIKQSVERLRAHRTHVEHLSQQNEELERQLARQKAENETLLREVFTLRGVEQENVAYLQSIKLQKERSRELEDACATKKLELRTAATKLSCVEHECDQLREEIQNSRQDRVDEVKVLRDKQKKLLQRIQQLEESHGAQVDDRKRTEHHWKQKMKAIARASSQTIDSLQQKLEQRFKETSKLETEMHELEEQVQNLLATTVRQTAVIEECDRVLSETKSKQQQTQCNYEAQLQLSSELSAKTQRLEVKVASLKQSKGSETVELERKVLLLENKLAEHQGQLIASEEALQNKNKEIEVIQRAYVTRDNNRHHLNEAIKELQRKERKLKSDISELQIALRNATDEKKLLGDQVLELQEQLENERKDRSRWATARVKLLAEFCDEESKLSTALNHHNGCRKSTHKQTQQIISPPSRKTKSKQAGTTRTSSNMNYDDDDSENDNQRRGTIVFG